MEGSTMNRARLSLLAVFAGTPAVAQDGAAQAVGTGVGFLIGLAITIVVGAVVGWLASLVVKGGGSGFWGHVLIGIGGSVLAGLLFPALGINLGSGLVGALVPALIGAILLLLVVRLIRGLAR
jgi:uncharacterized membrane protein YeaQ/YmgE (transglycosylase-associated protein family)